MSTKQEQYNKGFTLVETLVAIAIFATSIVGLISITARGVNDNVFVKNKLIASYLSQEGVELVRNMRDTSVLPENAVDWNTFLTDQTNWVGNCYRSTVANTNACAIDGTLTELAAEECVDGVCSPIGFDTTTSTYTYNSISDSIFTRTIYIQPVTGGNPNEALIVSDVSWNQGGNEYNVSYQHNIFNWFNP